MFKKIGLFVASFVMAFEAGQPVLANQENIISGILDKKSKDVFSVKNEKNVIEFKVNNAVSNLLEKAKSGDTVTVWYQLEAVKLELNGPAIRQRQLPGRVEKTPPKTEPMPKPQADDRIFYDA